jgi:hypothetical protein
MTLTESVRYLESAGIHYKPAESPELWAHLEGHFEGPCRVGSKFSRLPASLVEEMIAKGEEALLAGLVADHRRTGRLGPVACLLAMPYAVGTEAAVPLGRVDKARILDLIEEAGTPSERLIHIIPAAADAIPCTYEMTVTGGLYADGHTAGYYDLVPGHADADCAWLATAEEIESLAREMEARIDDIAIMPRHECEGMIVRARKALGG